MPAGLRKRDSASHATNHYFIRLNNNLTMSMP